MRLRTAIKVYRKLYESNFDCSYREGTCRKACERISRLIPHPRKTELKKKAMRVWSLISFDSVYPNAEPLPNADWGDK